MKTAIQLFLPDCLNHKKIMELVSTAINFNCDIFIEKNKEKYNVKSFINMCTMNGLKGEIFLYAVGSDSSTAMEKLYPLLLTNK
ncbi:HPr family phosphocarrier protein [Bacillus taeanensis]|uniref:HPr domain-containing protein n=1 Tax=Bacillus taeanensis TaxID=273032 RepID=A0A366XYM4_9BACI|nr:HPr family phosphocarrier protein [Bacillus taeanensis]RBW69264.1 hypothetical protein DS031_12865 [Bacillus taeanensis]